MTIGLSLLGGIALVWLVPAAWARRRGHQFEIRSHGQIDVDTPLHDVSAWLRDADNLSIYEFKADRCTAEIRDGHQTYTVFGSFFGIPWTGTFSMENTPDGGFHSVMIEGPHTDNADGGFRLKALPNDRTRVTHYESYRINVWLPGAVLVRGLIQGWLDRTIAGEMVILDRELGAIEASSSARAG